MPAHRHHLFRPSLAAAGVAALFVTALAGSAAAQTMEHEEPPSADRPEIVAHTFGSVEWGDSGEAGAPNSFALGQLALFVTSSINDRLSVLAELVIEASAANTEVITDLERLQLTYHVNDHLNLSAGRYHTGIGYYNAAFHHGSYFETPIGRPRIYAFEDEGGPLPIHEVGVSVRGTVPKTDSMLHYVAEVGNGRRWTDLTEHEGLDQNGTKSTNLGLSLRPERWRGAEFGGSFYRDTVPGSGDTAVANQILAAYGVYRTPAIELMAEWLRLSYRELGSGTTFNNHGGYVQASHAFGKLRPYYRFDRLDIDPDTPLVGSFGSSRTHVIGLRVDPVPWVGVKAQYERLHEQNRGDANGVHVQLVFVF